MWCVPGVVGVFVVVFDQKANELKCETTNFCPVFQLLIICLTKKVHQKKIKNLFITTAGAENDVKKRTPLFRVG